MSAQAGITDQAPLAQPAEQLSELAAPGSAAAQEEMASASAVQHTLRLVGF